MTQADADMLAGDLTRLSGIAATACRSPHRKHIANIVFVSHLIEDGSYDAMNQHADPAYGFPNPTPTFASAAAVNMFEP